MQKGTGTERTVPHWALCKAHTYIHVHRLNQALCVCDQLLWTRKNTYSTFSNQCTLVANRSFGCCCFPCRWFSTGCFSGLNLSQLQIKQSPRPRIYFQLQAFIPICMNNTAFLHRSQPPQLEAGVPHLRRQQQNELQQNKSYSVGGQPSLKEQFSQLTKQTGLWIGKNMVTNVCDVQATDRFPQPNNHVSHNHCMSNMIVWKAIIWVSKGK